MNNITEVLKFILNSDSTRSCCMYSTNFNFNNKIGLVYHDLPKNKLFIDAKLGKNKTNFDIEYDYQSNRVSIAITEYAGFFKIHLANIESTMCCTEEEYFMESTVRDLTPFTLEDYQLLSKIYNKYSRIVRYGK